MAAETHPSSSSSSDNYDVFLSFRGADTRRNFTDHLYNALIQAGIRTFRDSEELHHGEEIGPKLLKSIEQSRISIPIFSKNYASSKWCLRELTKIMECKKTCDQIVWPIFYKVEPSHVRNQTECFEEAFLEHKKEQCEDEVRAWRHALTEAGKLIGWDSEAPKYSLESSDLIKSVVDEALTEVIQITTLHVAKHPIGIDSHVEKVMRMLDVESQGVLFVGIHGMGGIGKTTTAKAVFNTISSQFKSRSFLADVREKASKGRGLVDLQNDLASDLLKGTNLRIGNVDHGINVLKNQFCNKKVLIVLDDVDHDEQLQALAGGCDWFRSGSRIIITTRDEHILHVDLVDKSKIYKPNELDKNLSVQLFSKHAFGRDQPPQDFMELSSRVVSIVGGLPLSLIVVGSFLRDKKEHAEWEDKLQMLKEFPQKEVQKQLKISYDGLYEVFKELFLDIACFFIGMDKESIILACDAKVGIKVLVYKSLVKIDSDNKLRMHDQLRDMGREIVRQENIKKPGKRSRLWSHKEALEVLKEYKGTRKVEGLFLDFGYQEKNHQIDFDSEAENYLTDCDHEAENVKLPQIDPADLLTKAFEKMSDLRLLQVDRADHDGNKFGHLPQGLKWLSLKGISCKCVPTISRLKKLAVLDLSGSDITDDWNGWQQIQLIGTLKVLDLSNCRLLKSTPHFSCDTSLERLILDDCINLVAFHKSIGHLKKLVFLSLDSCYKLTELPDSICKLGSIRSLILSRCFKLEKLPKALGNMESLTELIIDSTRIEEIPDSIGLLEKLETLSAWNCGILEKLPNLSNLKSLQALCLSDCENLFEIQGISGLSLLQQLDLEGCKTLKLLPELPPGLIKLNIRSCTSMERLPNLSSLKNLKELGLDNCHELAKIEGIDGLTLLQELDLTECYELQSLPELPSSLIKLDARECCSIETLPNLSNLKSLQVLHLCCSNLSEIQDISGLSLLQELDLTDCKMLQYLPGLPSSLIKLEIEGCKSMERLPNLSSLRSLQVLCLSNCMNLANIQGMNDLTLLQKLYLRRCSKLQSLSELPSSLTRIHVYDCENLFEIQGLNGLTLLQELDLGFCSKLQSLSELPSSLTSIHVYACKNLFEIQGINGLTLLQELELEGCSKLQSLSELPSSLTRIHVYGCENLFEIQGINGLTLLQELDLQYCSKLQSLSELPSSLTRIHVYGCENLSEIQGFSDLSLLQTLRLDSCPKLQSLDLSNLRILESLCLEDCDNLAEIRGLESLESLIELQVRGCYTYVKTLPKSVAKGMLPTAAFNEGNKSKSNLIPDDDNIKGTIFYFVYYPTSSRPILDFSISAQIRRNGCNRTITCSHGLRLEGMDVNTNKDLLFYSCYFQGLTWFGFPLKKRDIIDVTCLYSAEVKMYDLVMEYEAMEDSQQLEKRVVRLITPTTKKRPREYDDADYQKQRI